MENSPSIALLSAVVIVSAHVAGAGAAEPAYPTKPIRVIVGFPPAGAADIFARMLGPKLTDAWGQTVVIDNRPGAGSTIGSEITANAVPDGHTLMVVSASYATSAGLYARQIKYHPIDSFIPITLIASNPNILLAHPSVTAKTVKDLIAAAAAAPGKFTLGSAGTGSITHLAGELFASMAKVKLTHVPYKGGGPNMIALLGGEIQLTVASIPASLGGLKAQRVKAFGVTSLIRSRVLPEVPTIAETGLPGYEALNWYGLLAPAGVPRPVTAKLYAEVSRILQMPDVVDMLAKQSADPGGMPPEAFRKFLVVEIAKWTGAIKSAGVPAP
jgi:tripartite-type tricarboxylate transporter receptor subunit TctC